MTDLGGSMRLGAQPCHLEPGTLAARSYGQEVVEERHRHRWEVNPAYLEVLRQHGMVISGSSQKGRLAEIIELPDHPFFIAGQFHPELRSRPTRPHPLFREFVGAAKARRGRAVRESVGSPSAEPVAEPSGSRAVFRGRWISRRRGGWPGIGTWEVVRPKDAAAVLPLTPDGDVLLVRQFRGRCRAELIEEIPAGLLDVEGEDPASCAARELFEETGFRHASLEPLGDLPHLAGLLERARASVLGPDRCGTGTRTGGGHRGRPAAVGRSGGRCPRRSDRRRQDRPRAAPHRRPKGRGVG